MADDIVVGIDGSPGADAALAFAIDEAGFRGLPLRIVCAWEPSPGQYLGETFAPTPDSFLQAEDRAQEVVRAALERVAADASLTATAVAVEGSPATVLVEQAGNATLLVVGSRGRSGAASLLLGSVSRTVVLHAPCPVVVVPSVDRSAG